MCLKLEGQLAGEGAHVLRRAVEPLLISPMPPCLKLMMEGVSYMDSTGVGVIVAIIRQMRERGGKLEIHGLSEIGRELLQILKVADLHECVMVAAEQEPSV